MSLDNIRLGHSALTDTIYLYRHGKDPALALEKREAERDVMAVLVQHMMHDSPKGSVKRFTLGDQRYELTLTPVDAEVEASILTGPVEVAADDREYPGGRFVPVGEIDVL